MALHLASQRGGAEFYPSCAHVEVLNAGWKSTGLSPGPTARFPEAHEAEEHGKLVFNIWDFDDVSDAMIQSRKIGIGAADKTDRFNSSTAGRCLARKCGMAAECTEMASWQFGGGLGSVLAFSPKEPSQQASMQPRDLMLCDEPLSRTAERDTG